MCAIQHVQMMALLSKLTTDLIIANVPSHQASNQHQISILLKADQLSVTLQRGVPLGKLATCINKPRESDLRPRVDRPALLPPPHTLHESLWHPEKMREICVKRRNMVKKNKRKKRRVPITSSLKGQFTDYQ